MKKSEMVKLYDVGHVTHTIYNDHTQTGRVVYNCDNRRSPFRFFGKATREVVGMVSRWFSRESAESDLLSAGFKKRNHIEWER